MLFKLLFVIGLLFTRSCAAECNLTEKKASLEEKAATEREEIIRWNQLSQASQGKFTEAKQQLMVLRAVLRINQDELLAATNRVHCAQNKLTEIEQISYQLKNKLDEQHEKKLCLERTINMRSAKRRKRNLKQKRQAPYPWSDAPNRFVPHQLTNQSPIEVNRKTDPRSLLSVAAANPKPVEFTALNGEKATKGFDQRGSDLDTVGVDLSKLSDIELLRNSLARQAWDKAPLEELSRNDFSGRPRVTGGQNSVPAPAPDRRSKGSSSNKAERLESPKRGSQCKDEGEAAKLHTVKLEIFRDEDLLRNLNEQLGEARALLTAEQNRLEEISRKICSIRYELKESERDAREKLDSMQQAQEQRLAHEEMLAEITKELEAVSVELMQVELDNLNKHNAKAEQHVARSKISG